MGVVKGDPVLMKVLEDQGATKILSEIATKQDENQNFLINRLAAQQLGELRDPAAIPSLIKCLFLFAPGRPDLRMNDVAAEALILIGRPSLEPLLGVLAGKDSTANAIAKHYIDAVKARRPDLATKMTVRQVTGGEASFALGALGFSEALDPLLQEASSSDTARKLNAAIALVRLDVPAEGATVVNDLVRFDIVGGNRVETSVYNFNIEKALRGDPAHNLKLQPLDVITIKQIPEWWEKKISMV